MENKEEPIRGVVASNSKTESAMVVLTYGFAIIAGVVAGYLVTYALLKIML